MARGFRFQAGEISGGVLLRDDRSRHAIMPGQAVAIHRGPEKPSMSAESETRTPKARQKDSLTVG